MFDSIRLKNFRSFSDSKAIPLRPLTLLVGPNNAGKSTILNAILLLAQTAQSRAVGEPLSTSGPMVDLGSFDDIIRGGASADSGQIAIDLRMSEEELVQAYEEFNFRESGPRRLPANELRLAFSFDSRADRINVDRATFQRDRRVTLDAAQGVARGSMARRTKQPSISFVSGFLPRLDWAEVDPDDLPIPEELTAHTDSMVQSMIWDQAFSRIELVAPLREPVPRLTVLGRTTPTPRGVASGGEAVLQLLRSTDPDNEREKRAVELVDYWLSKRFTLTKRLRILEVDRARRVLSLVADQAGGFSAINVANMGEGVSQLLPIVASVVMATRGQTTLVEQPELHLHPAAQAELGDLMIAGIGDAGDRQVIVETHSEHLLLRVRRRIAEGALDPQKVAIIFVEKPAGASRARFLSLDSRGDIDDWPDGFFDEAYQEALQLALASSQQ
jgi:predicted ATPase